MPPSPLARAAAATDRHAIDPERALATEWLETDGHGGFATASVALVPRRRFHGLLVVPQPGSGDRHVLLARIDERVRRADDRGPWHALTTAEFDAESATTAAPPRRASDSAALASLRAFAPRPWPRWEHAVAAGEMQVRREFVMPRNRGGRALLRWTNVGTAAVELELFPGFAYRATDRLHVRNDVLDPRVERIDGGIRLRCYASLPAVAITIGLTARATVTWADDATWIERLVHSIDRARGDDGHDDLFCPGSFRVFLEPGADVVLAASTGDGQVGVSDPRRAWTEATAARRDSTPATAGVRDRTLAGCDAFLYRDENGRLGVQAGYPWFGEWGRVTFVALPGLTLSRGHRDRCEEVLVGAIPFLVDGLLPDVFGLDAAGSRYGSADAALWYARAVLLWQRDVERGDATPTERTRARALLFDTFLPTLTAIADGYLTGAGRAADLGIALDDDGQLRVAGSATVPNPTWMNAVRGDGEAVTPRTGCPIEIAALWYSLLQHLTDLCRAAGDRDAKHRWLDRSQRAGGGFIRRFSAAADALDGVLPDVRDATGSDLRLRPNAVLAAALEFSPLTRAMRSRLLAHVDRDLLTPRGLRTLAPSAEDYVGHYGGAAAARDAAYHRGTVWPWLLGAWVEAGLRARDRRDDAFVARARRQLDALEPHLDEAGLEYLSEVFDGDAPHAPGGTIAQAWNHGEVTRAFALLDAAASGEFWTHGSPAPIERV